MHEYDEEIEGKEDRHTALNAAVQCIPRDERALPGEVIVMAGIFLEWLRHG